MDPEAEIRQKMSVDLEKHFVVFEEVELLSSYCHNIRCDLLLITTDASRKFCFAVEIKSKPPLQAKNYRDTFFQAFNYVGARCTDKRLQGEVVDFAFIYQEKGEFSNIIDITPLNRGFLEQYWMIKGIELAYNPLSVGYIYYDERQRIELRAGSNRFWSEKKGWSTDFERRMGSRGSTR